MNAIVGLDVERLGREAAEYVAGADAVEQVEVTQSVDDDDRPTYFFTFLIDQSRVRQRIGLFRIRLIQKLQDDLILNNDDHRPVIQLLSKEDWAKRADARSI